MSRNRVSTLFLTVSSVITMLIMGAGGSFAAHPTVDSQGNPINIPVYTFEEIADQFNYPKMPVQVDPTSMQGMPFSPKQTCGGCHDYDSISSHAFHSAQGFYEFKDTADGNFNTAQAKPWTQSGGMFGKW